VELSAHSIRATARPDLVPVPADAAGSAGTGRSVLGPSPGWLSAPVSQPSLYYGRGFRKPEPELKGLGRQSSVGMDGFAELTVLGPDLLPQGRVTQRKHGRLV
jgi:hypothetical protein